MKAIQVSARVDPSIKESAQKVFERQGLDMATAIKMFITKTAYEQQIPLS
ncbi:type II toxin-antitoxin system RelB/DinJ family antitoxin, partial [Leuconostoc citreum]